MHVPTYMKSMDAHTNGKTEEQGTLKGNFLSGWHREVVKRQNVEVWTSLPWLVFVCSTGADLVHSPWLLIMVSL